MNNRRVASRFAIMHIAKRGLILFAGILFVNIATAQVDTISVSPALPTSTDGITIVVTGFNPVSPTGLYSYSSQLVGTTLRLYACINRYGFSAPSGYIIVYPTMTLSPGVYAIEYYRATCDTQLGVVVFIDPYVITATTTVTVTAAVDAQAIPTTGTYGIAMLALAIFGLACCQRALRQGPCPKS